MKINTNKNEMKLGFAALVYSLVLLFVLINSFTSGLINPDKENWVFFYMFTNQSNFLVLIWLTMFGISAFVETPFKKFITNRTVIVAVTVYISITFFIVATVLEPFYLGQFDPVAGYITHFSTPIVMWFYFFAVKGNGSMKLRQAFYTLIYPLIFLVLNLIIGATVLYLDGSRAYAYNFINPASVGMSPTPALSIALLALNALASG